jgi:hypothetical protein
MNIKGMSEAKVAKILEVGAYSSLHCAWFASHHAPLNSPWMPDLRGGAL